MNMECEESAQQQQQLPTTATKRIKRIVELVSLEGTPLNHDSFQQADRLPIGDILPVLKEICPPDLFAKVDVTPLRGNAREFFRAIMVIIATEANLEAVDAWTSANNIKWSCPDEIVQNLTPVLTNWAIMRDSAEDFKGKYVAAQEREREREREKEKKKKSSEQEGFDWTAGDAPIPHDLSKVMHTVRSSFEKFGGTASRPYKDFADKIGVFAPEKSWTPRGTQGGSSATDDTLYTALTKFERPLNWLGLIVQDLAAEDPTQLYDPNSLVSALMETLVLFHGAWESAEYTRKTSIAGANAAKALQNPAVAPKPRQFTDEEIKLMDKSFKDQRTIKGKSWANQARNSSSTYSRRGRGRGRGGGGGGNGGGGNGQNYNNSNNNNGYRSNSNSNNNSRSNSNSSRGGRGGGRGRSGGRGRNHA